MNERRSNSTTDLVREERGRGGLAKLCVREAGGHELEIYLHGATVTSWHGPEVGELLFASAQALFLPGKAIRGGIPLVFPQFAGDGPLPSHGIARTAAWQFVRAEELPTKETRVILGLHSTPESRAIWDHEFALEYEIRLGRDLQTILRVANPDSTQSLEFQNAFHTYFAVSEIGAVTVSGLGGLDYLDNMKRRERGHDARGSVTIDGEVDRVYLAAPDTIEIYDRAAERTLTLTKQGMSDAVLWNPWIAKSQSLTDLGDDEYRRFVCLEFGNISERVAIAPLGSAVMSQRMSYR